MLIGRDRIDAAIAAMVGSDAIRLAVEAELVQEGRLGHTGLLVLTSDCLIFATEPRTEQPEVHVFGLKDASCALERGFLGPELGLRAANEPPARLRHLAAADLAALHQALFGEELQAERVLLEGWRSLGGAGEATDASEAGGGSSILIAAWRPLQQSAITSASAGETPDVEREARAEGGKARPDPEALAKRRAAKAAAKARAQARAAKSSAEERGAGKTPDKAPAGKSAAASGTATPQAKGSGFWRFVGTVTAVVVAVKVGASAGSALAEQEIAGGAGAAALAEARDLCGSVVDLLAGLWIPFALYFVISFFVLLAKRHGRTLYSMGLFQLNVATMLAMAFLNSAADSANTDFVARLQELETTESTDASASGETDKAGQAAGEASAGQAQAQDGATQPSAAGSEQAAQAPAGAAEDADGKGGEPSARTGDNRAQQAPSGTEAAAGQDGGAEAGSDDEQAAAAQDAVSPELVDVVRARAPQLQVCFKRANLRPGGVIELTVHPTGKLRRVTYEGSDDTPRPALEHCLRRTMQGWRFPATGGEEQTLRISLGQ